VSVYVVGARDDVRLRKMWMLIESVPSEKVRLAQTLVREALKGVRAVVRLENPPVPPHDPASVVFAPAHSYVDPELSQTEGSVPLMVMLRSVLPSLVTLMGEGFEKPPTLEPPPEVLMAVPAVPLVRVPDPNSIMAGVMVMADVASTVTFTWADPVVAKPVIAERSLPAE